MQNIYKLRKLKENVLEFHPDLCDRVEEILAIHGKDLEVVTLYVNGGNHTANNHHLFKCECQLEFENGTVFDFDKDFKAGKVFIIRYFPHFGGIVEAIVTSANDPRWASVTLSVSMEDLKPKVEPSTGNIRFVSWLGLADKDAKQSAEALREKYPFLSVRIVNCNTAITCDGMVNRVTIWCKQDGTCYKAPDAEMVEFDKLKSIDAFLE